MNRHLTVLVAAALSGCRSLPPAQAPEAHHLRVLVYNIHAGKDARLHDNIARVAAVVKSTNADIVLLQEVDRDTRRSGGQDQPAMLAEATGLHVAFGRTLDYDGGQYGIAMLSRWPIDHDTLIHMPIEPPQARAGGSYEPRGALRATIAAPSGPLTVVNTHLDPSADDHYRRQEVETLLRIARESGTGRLLLGGDLNSTPESAVQQTMRASGLRDSWQECGRGAGLTYPADSSVKRIDYLYLGARARCTKAAVLGDQASDHRGVLFDVVVEPATARN
jgi:endonuclease/exonuclease/phosphatase family metal-dependent hydrolase